MDQQAKSTEFEIIDGRTGTVLNIEAELAIAPDSETIHRLLSCGNSAKPSGTLRRRWLRAANLRYQQLRNAGEASKIPYLNSPVSSENAEKTGEKSDSAAGDEGV